MEYKVIKGVKGLKKYGYYKNLKYKINDNIGNRVEFYIANDIQEIIYKKFYKYLGITKTDDLIDMYDIPNNVEKEQYNEVIKNYIDTRLQEFVGKLEKVVMYYSYNKQIKSQNARIRVSKWFDKGDYRELAWLQEQKENLEKTMR